MTRLERELLELRVEFGAADKYTVSAKETEELRRKLKDGGELPEGYYCSDEDFDAEYARFYRIEPSQLSDAQLAEYLSYKKLKLIKIIKNGVIFLVVCGAVWLVSLIYALLGLM